MRIAKLLAVSTVAAATLFLSACANQKEPAEKAVAQVESSFAEVKADAEKYAADEFKEVNDSVENLKSNLARKDYGAVVRMTPAVTSSIATLKTTVEQRKADADQMLAAATTEWNEITASVPGLVDSLQKRVDQLGKTKRYPKGLDKAGFDTAKTDFDTLKTDWTTASADFAAGKAAEALRKARAIKAQAEDLAKRLEAKVS
jgi:hypothetical protein